MLQAHKYSMSLVNPWKENIRPHVSHFRYNYLSKYLHSNDFMFKNNLFVVLHPYLFIFALQSPIA